MSLDQTSGATAFLPPSEGNGRSSIHSAESADGARFTAGTIFSDRYRTVRLLGRGGMGDVYLAEDTRLHRKPNLFSRGFTTKDVVLISGFKK